MGAQRVVCYRIVYIRGEPTPSTRGEWEEKRKGNVCGERGVYVLLQVDPTPVAAAHVFPARDSVHEACAPAQSPRYADSSDNTQIGMQIAYRSLLGDASVQRYCRLSVNDADDEFIYVNLPQ